MTVSSSVAKSGPYAGAGTTGPFTVGFRFLENSHLRVVRTSTTGVDTTLVLNTEYSVSGAGGDSGTVTLVTALAVGEKLTIIRNVPATQEADYVENDSFPAESHETALDKLTMLVQQNGEAIDRSIKVGVSDTPLSPLPSPTSRANTVIGFDALGNVTVLPIPSSLGAGDRVDFTLVGGVDFTAGVTTQITLPRAPGSKGNLEIFFDPLFQGFDQWSVAGQIVTFTSPIPVGVSKIFGYIGTTLSIFIPPNGSVGDDQLTWGTILNRVVDSVAALRLLDGSKYKRSFVAGYYAAGDGGGGNYYLDGTDVISADNGGTTIVANDGARWKLIHTGSVSVRQFGAKGDNVTLDTAAIQTWLNTLSASKIRGTIPTGTYLSAGLILPSNVYIDGEDMFNSILRSRNGLNANFITSSSYATADPLNGNRNIYLNNFTIDANGTNQTAGSYPLSIQYVDGLEISRVNMINPYGTLLWVSQSDNLGTGPGGRVAAPYGQYFNFNVYIHDCIFNGTGQVETNADLNVIGSTQNSRIERNEFVGGGANCLSYQFARGGKVSGNVFSTFMRGLFVESCFDCVFDGNDFSVGGVRSPLTPGAWYNGLWLASANESYGGGAGFATSSNNVVTGNVFHDYNVSDQTNPVVAIRTSGYAGSLASQFNLIAGNRVTNFWNTSGVTPATHHILLEGQCNSVRVVNNICDGNGTVVGHIGIYLGGLSYGGAAQLINCGATGNLVANINTGIYQLGSAHTGTSLVGNTLNGCPQQTNIANPGQASYVASANN